MPGHGRGEPYREHRRPNSLNQATSRLPHGAGSPIFQRVFGLLTGSGTAPETSAPRCSGNGLQPYRGLACLSRAVGVDRAVTSPWHPHVQTLKKRAPGHPVPRRSGRVLDGSRHMVRHAPAGGRRLRRPGRILGAGGRPSGADRARHRDRRGTLDHHDQLEQSRPPRYVARRHHRGRRTGDASVSRGQHPDGGDPVGGGHRDHPPESGRPDGRTVRSAQPRARHVGRGHPGAGPVAGRAAGPARRLHGGDRRRRFARSAADRRRLAGAGRRAVDLGI